MYTYVKNKFYQATLDYSYKEKKIDRNRLACELFYLNYSEFVLDLECTIDK